MNNKREVIALCLSLHAEPSEAVDAEVDQPESVNGGKVRFESPGVYASIDIRSSSRYLGRPLLSSNVVLSPRRTDGLLNADMANCTLTVPAVVGLQKATYSRINPTVIDVGPDAP
ncbi:hypothetical protein [Fuerstiella marisgermanici]|uniref:hypothetical protein n=1 Tax=Fuerstiella marisgermanici TaxID=1891926 RepID=UPI00097BB191|nr:hypothetical protein [Fuerstiella marisgermanici]